MGDFLKNENELFIIIGSSRGLGAAFVEELISRDIFNIIGISRTGLSEIENGTKWARSGKYYHLQQDISSPECPDLLGSLCSELPGRPVNIIFNAACLKSDVNDRSIKRDVFNETINTGINGLNNVLLAFEEHLNKHGGRLVGISSFSASTPLFRELRVAYPATKSYLDMVFNCLRAAWPENIEIITITLGAVGKHHDLTLANFLVPDYKMAANKLINTILKSGLAKIYYPLAFNVFFKIIKYLPNWFHSLLIRLLPTMKKS